MQTEYTPSFPMGLRSTPVDLPVRTSTAQPLPAEMRFLSKDGVGVQPQFERVPTKGLPPRSSLVLVSTGDAPPVIAGGGGNGNRPLHPANDHIKRQLENVLHPLRNNGNDGKKQYEGARRMLVMLSNDIQQGLIPGLNTMTDPADRDELNRLKDVIGEVARELKNWERLRNDIDNSTGNPDDLRELHNQEEAIAGNIVRLITNNGNTREKAVERQRTALTNAYEAQAKEKIAPLEKEKAKVDGELESKRNEAYALSRTLHDMDFEEPSLESKIAKLKKDKEKELKGLDPSRNTPEVIAWTERNYNNRIADAEEALQKLRRDRLRLEQERDKLVAEADKLKLRSLEMAVNIRRMEDELSVDLQLFELEEEYRPVLQLAGVIPMDPDLGLPQRPLTPFERAQGERVALTMPMMLRDYQAKKKRLEALKAGKYVANGQVDQAKANLDKYVEDKKVRDEAVEKARAAKVGEQTKWAEGYDGFPLMLTPHSSTDADLTGNGLRMSDLVQILNTNRGEFNILGLSRKKGISKEMLNDAIKRVDNPDAIELELISRGAAPDKAKAITDEIRKNKAQLKAALENMVKNFSTFDPNGDGVFNQADAGAVSAELLKKVAKKMIAMSPAEFAQFETWANENGQGEVAKNVKRARGLPFGNETAIIEFGQSAIKDELANNLRRFLLIE